MPYKLITAPVAEPVSLTDTKNHLKVEVSTDDTLIGALIQSAREIVEQFTRRALMSQTWELQIDSFTESEYALEKTPVQSITSVKYIDQNGVEQTLSAAYYTLDQASEPNKILQASGYTWPSVRGFTNDVKIRFVSGYASAALVPAALRSAILLIVGHLYENREDVVVGRQVNSLPNGAEYLMYPYRLFTY
jgi:uncharacterized phiE125 gp8 family phage protein